MKILELDLSAFGPFANAKLNLAEGREEMHILYGPNEAGKSSALRALKCLLFRIPKNSADNFLHDNKALRIGGRLRNSDGAELAFLRRKGNKDTLLSPDGEPIDERKLDMYLHGVTEEVFGLLFGIDHDALVAGGRNILEGKGETGQSLFAAGAGGANLRAMLEAIEVETEALFKNRGQLPFINKAISRHQELRKKILELSQSSREWAEKENELKKAKRTERFNQFVMELKGRYGVTIEEDAVNALDGPQGICNLPERHDPEDVGAVAEDAEPVPRAHDAHHLLGRLPGHVDLARVGAVG